jgi:hypothetical protein
MLKVIDSKGCVITGVTQVIWVNLLP